MDLEKRIELITKLPIEEVITIEDLRKLLETKTKVTAYDGFEPSGLLHLGSGILRAIKIEDLLEAKVDFILWVADWFAWINNKLGGDLEFIKKAGEYIVEGWKACGVDIKKVRILWTSDAVKDPNYWKGMLEAAKLTTIKRAIRTAPIMGRSETEMMFTAQLFYPFMQAYDPFYFGADILQLGMDQRHVTILSRELAPKLKKLKPVLVHHHLLIGLQGPSSGRMGAFNLENSKLGSEKLSIEEAKMSKSKPENAIFIHDTKEQLRNKINNAFCPPKVVEGNPILEIWKYIIFRKFDSRKIKRKDKKPIEVQSYEELEKAYMEDLHPADLKNETTEALDEILAPIRQHFEKDKKAKELYQLVKSVKVTR